MSKVVKELADIARELKAMDVTLGEDGLDKSWQASFPKTTKCCRCGAESRIGFVAHEGLAGMEAGEDAVWKMHSNMGQGSFWLHDRVAVAVYFCKGCLEPTAQYNQA